MNKEDYFIPQNAVVKNRNEEFSFSGRYKLVRTPYSTKAGSWNYTQGLVYRVGSDEPITEVQRNYSSFPYLFVENHPNGHDYLICGENYQGQTVIELDTGKRLDYLPSAAQKGVGFCWVYYEFDKQLQMLVVDGCIWACPNEYRFFDFSNPMMGWAEIEPDECPYHDDKFPTVNSDGTITCYQLKSSYDDGDDEIEKEGEVVATQTFKREGTKFIFQDEWVSEEEKQNRILREQKNKEWKDWWNNFCSTDPLFLLHKELINNSIFNPPKYPHLSTGITYEGWCSDFHEKETRICRRIHEGLTKGYTIYLEWAAKTGPIKLVVHKDGEKFENKFFEHSIEGMREAFLYARKLVESYQ